MLLAARSGQQLHGRRSESEFRFDRTERRRHDHLHDCDRRRRSERPAGHQHRQPRLHQPAGPERNESESDRVGDARRLRQLDRRAEWPRRRRRAQRLRRHRVGDDHGPPPVLTNSLSGTVFGDTNEDGVFDAGDALLSGVPMALVNEATGITVATATTNASGFYQFTNIPNGEYAVLETKQPNGYNDGNDFPGSAGGVADPVPGDAIRHVILGGGVNAINYNFGECPCPPAQLSGFVYEDFSTPGAATNNDGIFEMNIEKPIAGVTVTLENLDGSPVTDFNGNLVAPTVTGANGFYQFTNLHAHLSYMVVETQPAGFADGKDTPGTTGGTVGPNNGIGTDFITNIPLDAGANSQMNNFGELPLATPATSINGFVYLDANKNGMKDPTEPGLPGVSVQLTTVTGAPVTDINGNVVGIMQTDANGFFQFTSLPVGNYEVRDLPPQPIFQGTQTLDGATTAGTVNGITRGTALVDVITNIDLVGGENSINNDFGKVLPSNVGAITLSGTVYFDANKNNVYDAGDSPIGGATVHLFRLGAITGLDEVAQMTTNNKGQYLFEIDTPGIYFVRLDNVPGLIKERPGWHGERPSEW